MLTKMTPFCKGGDLYFVGTKEMSSHILDTGDGLIMIDVGTMENFGCVLEGMETLGLSVKDLKMLLISHYHYDHGEAAPALRRMVARAGGDLKVGASAIDAPLLGFPVDFTLTEGSKVTLGKYTIECLLTPGHTSGVLSFLFDMEVNGKTIRLGMFGGAGINQMAYQFMINHRVQFHVRQQYYRSVKRLLDMKVDMIVGNHTHNEKGPERYAEWAENVFSAEKNPFVNPENWSDFLKLSLKRLEDLMRKEAKEHFVNYAHRGFSAEYPENTLLAFRMGFKAGANGVELDVRRTKDGQIIVTHDATLKKLGHSEMEISECTFDEIDAVMVEKNGPLGGACTLSEVLANIGFTSERQFAIELKAPGLEKEVADLVYEFVMPENVIITSFRYEYLKEMRQVAPMLRVGYLCKAEDVTEELLDRMTEDGIDQLCPEATAVTPENVDKWHAMGFTVRAWGVSNEDTMKRVFASGVDGMTVNFPDKLKSYMDACKAED